MLNKKMKDIPFEEEEYCQECGIKGAYEIDGDYLCEVCRYWDASSYDTEIDKDGYNIHLKEERDV